MKLKGFLWAVVILFIIGIVIDKNDKSHQDRYKPAIRKANEVKRPVAVPQVTYKKSSISGKKIKIHTVTDQEKAKFAAKMKADKIGFDELLDGMNYSAMQYDNRFTKVIGLMALSNSCEFNDQPDEARKHKNKAEELEQAMEENVYYINLIEHALRTTYPDKYTHGKSPSGANFSSYYEPH